MNAEKIRKAYLNAAKLVQLFGDAYLPVFLRLHDEMKNLQQQADLRSIALSIAESQLK